MIGKRTKRVLIGLALVVLLIVGALAMMSLFSRKPSNLGVVDGRLAPCPASPNCVCTQATEAEHRMEPISFTGSPNEALQRIKAVVAQMPRTKIVTVEDNYLHAEFRSAIFRFVDDVEFLFDPESQLIHFRSASRVGHSDLGVNRRRMEKIRAAFGG
jgi:uncharacterized protein (DUF1499 family)